MAETLTEFLLAEADKEEKIEVVVSARFAKANHKFVVRALTGEEHNEIQQLCTSRKKKKVDFNSKLYSERIILTGCVEPNFKSAELLKKAGVQTPEQLIYKLLKAGEISTLVDEILTASGFNQDVEELETEVKNY